MKKLFRLRLIHGMQYDLRQLLTVVVIFAVGLAIFLVIRRGSSLPRLLKAATDGDLSSIRRLVESGQNPNEQDGWNTSPMMMAAAYGRTDAIQMLLDYGVSVDERSRFSMTPLMHAAKNGRLLAVKLLVQKKANMEFKDSNGYTALELAFRENHYGVVRFLETAERQMGTERQTTSNGDRSN